MNRYEILKHPEMRPVTSEEAEFMWRKKNEDRELRKREKEIKEKQDVIRDHGLINLGPSPLESVVGIHRHFGLHYSRVSRIVAGRVKAKGKT